jgi:hypothetical protein
LMDRDTITRTGARAPGVERLSRSHGGVALSHEPRHRARIIQGVRRHEGRVQTKRREAQAPRGQAPFDKPALEPYWGKPAVRNLREDDGNVGIIRSPVRAIVLPDQWLCLSAEVREKVTRLIARMLSKHEVCNRPDQADGGHDDE